MADPLNTPAVSEINQIAYTSTDFEKHMNEATTHPSQTSSGTGCVDPAMNSIVEDVVLRSWNESEATHSLVPGTAELDAPSSPTLEIDAHAAQSAPSSISSASEPSTSSSRVSDGGLSVRKRGYIRPQATIFAESAKNRESVMSLGSIAHLQYYFARTGLLDGKGAQMAPKNLQIKIPSSTLQRSISLGVPSASTSSLSPVSSTYAASDTGTMSESPLDTVDDAQWNKELAMLPPTVSTYNQRLAYVPPPPDLTMLRRELTDALEEALKSLKDTDATDSDSDSQGWYQIQGIHILDTVTLAIRAAKNYYTAHSKYQKLHNIKSEREIRRELYQVLGILKRMAARNFSGGLRQIEKVGILSWIVGISELIQAEIDDEKREAEQRKAWTWRNDDWDGRERERELAFMRSFVEDPGALPEWTSTAHSDITHPSPLLLCLASGVVLVQLHNTLVSASNRPFALIKSFHTDTTKPYRRAENLRFWIKAAELRWDVHVAKDVDVLGVATGNGKPEVWSGFETAILKWCKTVREELAKEWADIEARRAKRAADEALNRSEDGIVSSTDDLSATAAADETLSRPDDELVSSTDELPANAAAPAVDSGSHASPLLEPSTQPIIDETSMTTTLPSS